MISLSVQNLSFSQIKISNLSLTDTTLPIAYQGVDNILSISGLRNREKVSLNSIYSSTRLTKNGVNSYIYWPSIMGRNDTVYLWDNDTIIAKQPFKIMKLNEPKLSLGNIRDSFITIIQAINNPYLSVYIPDNYFKYKMHIVSFELFKIKNRDTISMYSSEIQNCYDTITSIDFETGKETLNIERKNARITKNFNERLTSYQLNEIRKMKSGNRLLFKEIIVSGGENGCYRKLYDYQVQIK